MITPTPEELAIRVTRGEKGQEDERAISYGIGTESGKDIAPTSSAPRDAVRNHKAGKAAFAAADVYERAVMVANEYDKHANRVTELEEAKTQGIDVEKDLATANTAKETSTEKMKFLRVPLDKSKRPVDFKELNIPKPSIQKLADLKGEDGLPSPLIATASGTTARTLIALHDLGAFNNEAGKFEPEAAQYISTILCGTIVHGGHHSVLEVGEMYNRLLDCDAVTKLEHKEYSRETEMGYYHIGDSSSLLPNAMKQPVVNNYNKKNQSDMRSELKQSVPPPSPDNDPEEVRIKT